MPARRRRLLLGGAGWVAAAMAVANGLGYLLNLVASRVLGPQGFGALGALLGLVLIGNVVALGLQTVTSRVLASSPDAGRHGAVLYRLAVRSAATVAVLSAATAPVLARVLHLRSPMAAWLLPLVLAPLTVTGVQLGLLQGAERFRRLGTLYLVAAAGKVGGGLIGVAVGGTVIATMVGTAVGAALSAGVGHRLVRPVRPSTRNSGGDGSGHVRELTWATHSLLVLFALTNIDVLLARHYLPAHEAGLYAAGAVVAKGAFWLPGVVAVVALPALSDTARRRRAAGASLAAVACCGALVTLACLARGELVVAAVGGSSYSGLAPHVWLFATAGSLFAMAQLLLYSRLAATDRRALVAMWVALLAVLAMVIIARHGSATEIVTSVVVVAGALVVAGILAEVAEHLLRRPIVATAQPTVADYDASAGQGPGL